MYYCLGVIESRAEIVDPFSRSPHMVNVGAWLSYSAATTSAEVRCACRISACNGGLHAGIRSESLFLGFRSRTDNIFRCVICSMYVRIQTLLANILVQTLSKEKAWMRCARLDYSLRQGYGVRLSLSQGRWE